MPPKPMPTKRKPSRLEIRLATHMAQIALAKVEVYHGLDPVDLVRCQGESRINLSPFTCGGQINQPWVRCDRLPSWVVVEPSVTHGTRGAMALCRGCKVECQTRHPRMIYAAAAPFKAAFRVGGHQAVKDMIYELPIAG